MLIVLKFNRHFAIKACASLHNIIHTPAIICRRSLLCIISYNAYKYQTVCCVISSNLPECCLTMSGKTKEKRKTIDCHVQCLLTLCVYMCKINFTCTCYDTNIMILFSIKTIPLLRPLGLSPQGGRYRGILLYRQVSWARGNIHCVRPLGRMHTILVFSCELKHIINRQDLLEARWMILSRWTLWETRQLGHPRSPSTEFFSKMLEIA